MAIKSTVAGLARNLLRRATRVIATLYEQRRRIAFYLSTVCVLALVIAVLLLLRNGWHTATADGGECQKGFQPLPYSINGYLEFFLEGQELIEPLFDGKYFISLAQEYGRNPTSIKVIMSGSRGYGSSTSLANLSWNESAQVLWMNDMGKMSFIAQRGSHRMFPFDSASFDFVVKTEPLVDIRVFRFNNRVPGFYMPCEDVRVSRVEDGSLRVSFKLQRDLLIVFAATLLFSAASIFAFAITIFVETKTLPTALASYFFSLWSTRGIFGLGSEGFPTLMDLGIVTLCILILALLAVRVLKRKLWGAALVT